MYKPARYLLVLVVIVLCMSVSFSGYAAIGTEPSNQVPETSYPALGPLTSVPSYPGVVPGIEGENTYFPSTNLATSLDAGQYYQPYNIVPSQNYGEMSGTMYPYPYYQDPYQYQGYQYPSYMQQYPSYSQQYPSYMQQYPSYPQQYPSYPQQYPSYPQQQYGSADQAYKQAMQAYRNKDYQSALSGFRAVASQYPQSDLADNAHYWMGEIYYAWKNYPAAIQSFQTVMYSYPRGNKLPDAMVKMGYTFAEMRQYNAARSILNDVVARFSDNTRIRNLAVKKLNEISNYYY